MKLDMLWLDLTNPKILEMLLLQGATLGVAFLLMQQWHDDQQRWPWLSQQKLIWQRSQI
jgi:hypothetical protein